MTHLKARTRQNQCVVNFDGATLFRYHHHVWRVVGNLRIKRFAFPVHAPAGGADHAGRFSDARWHNGFYRSRRGVKISTELVLLLQNWTLSLIFCAGLIAFNNDFDNRLAVWLAWYLLSSVGPVLSRSFIRYGAGWLRNRGYNTRRVAVAGDLPAGQMLLDSFRHEPWLGFEVAGIYHDLSRKNSRDWAGNLQQLVDDAKASRIHNVYIAMSMSDGASVKKWFASWPTPPVQ